jgi:superfamily II DNA/RNA helicase
MVVGRPEPIQVCEGRHTFVSTMSSFRRQRPASPADVLVVTDKLSEGVDLHRYCRHLIHYELDPSPIRTVQRNGRLRRVNSWAAVTRRPIRYAYPAFRGTRDYRLVQVMKKRVDSFSLLLGGVQDFEIDNIADHEERWRDDVIKIARDRLSKAGSQLRARDPALFALDQAARAACRPDVSFRSKAKPVQRLAKTGIPARP